jgi:hypothetical protein
MAGYTFRTERRNMVSQEYKNNIIMHKSNHSYALNKKIIEKFDTNSWLGKRCFIIGGGESLKGFDFSKLDNELTISINKAFKFYQNSTINYSMDSTFYSQMYQGNFDKPGEPKLINFWKTYTGVRVFLTPMEIKQFSKEVYLVRKELSPFVNRTNLDTGIYGGNNSGTGAISLAVALGANPIYLLGYDMKAEKSTHWHEGYDNRSIDDFNNKLIGYRDDITKFSLLLSAHRITVVNLNRNSGLTCFPFADFESIIKLQNGVI